jgi:glyoxylase I family protein
VNRIRIHHVSIVVADVQDALGFYETLLGLEVDPSRPEMGFEGAWLKVGGQQIHLLQVPNPDPVAGRPAHAGRDRHLALLVERLDDCERLLTAAGIPFTRSRSGRRALFCRDPDGNGVELIEAAAAQPD